MRHGHSRFVSVVAPRGGTSAIVYTDGEMYWSYFKKAGIDWGDPVDALVERFIEDGYFMPIASTFGDLLV